MAHEDAPDSPSARDTRERDLLRELAEVTGKRAIGSEASPSPERPRPELAEATPTTGEAADD